MRIKSKEKREQKEADEKVKKEEERLKGLYLEREIAKLKGEIAELEDEIENPEKKKDFDWATEKDLSKLSYSQLAARRYSAQLYCFSHHLNSSRDRKY
jgi:hypothetical protein